MIDIIYKGFSIGILVSAPMGPVGLLIIQRTLNKDRWHGFFSGVGAAGSDLFYATITCMGMGIVVSFIEKSQSVLQLVGSIFLFFYGLYTFRTNPVKNLHKGGVKTRTYSQDTLSAFLLTLSNPLILVLYIALFARFNFIASNDKVYSMLVGLSSILLGALAWWYFVTYLVSHLRKIINVRTLWMINRVFGVIIMALSVLGIVLAFV
ncbi:MAG: LysE family transporter [Candidatus Symbiothrix sp.]|nr:LysE family transporter [Candidatus Symbiothrix sp.]